MVINLCSFLLQLDNSDYTELILQTVCSEKVSEVQKIGNAAF